MLSQTTPTPERVIAVIDHRTLFRFGITKTLEMIHPSKRIIGVESYSELEQKAVAKWPDIILFGTRNLSDPEVISFVRKIRQQSSFCKIALYDYRNTTASILSFFQERIDGYLTENFDKEKLQECLNKLETGQLYVSQEIANQLLTFKLDYKPQKVTALSEMESKVAQYLLKGVGVSMIAKTLDRRTSTISTVKAKIFKKMRVDNIIDLARILESA